MTAARGANHGTQSYRPLGVQISQAEELAAKLNEVSLTFTRKAGEAGHLFGSVTSADIAHELAAQGHEVDRRKIQLGDPLKTVGDFKVAIRLHREVTARVTVKVQAEVEEGEAQAAAPAAAEGVTAPAAEESAAE